MSPTWESQVLSETSKTSSDVGVPIMTYRYDFALGEAHPLI
jgi:hypothetical protein